MACLAAVYAETTGLPCLPSTDEMLMIRPQPRGIISLNAARMPQKVE